MTSEALYFLIDEIEDDYAYEDWLVDSICNNPGEVSDHLSDDEYERMRAEHYYPERAAAIAVMGRRIRNARATLSRWDDVALASLGRVLDAVRAGTTADLDDTEREILDMLQSDTLPLPSFRIRKPRRTAPAPLRDIPRRAYGKRRDRLRKPEPCLPNRLAAHGPPRSYVARCRATAAPVRSVTHNLGPP